MRSTPTPSSWASPANLGDTNSRLALLPVSQSLDVARPILFYGKLGG
jgi:hypothetical protein